MYDEFFFDRNRTSVTGFSCAEWFSVSAGRSEFILSPTLAVYVRCNDWDQGVRSCFQKRCTMHLKMPLHHAKRLLRPYYTRAPSREPVVTLASVHPDFPPPAFFGEPAPLVLCLPPSLCPGELSGPPSCGFLASLLSLFAGLISRGCPFYFHSPISLHPHSHHRLPSPSPLQMINTHTRFRPTSTVALLTLRARLTRIKGLVRLSRFSVGSGFGVFGALGLERVFGLVVFVGVARCWRGVEA